MKTIAHKYYDATDDKMYDKPGQILDILLVGKHGTRRVNSLMKEFTNNQGVVERTEDLELLADTVVAFYKDQWDKRYEALTIDYGMLDPYHLEKSVEVTGSKSSSNIKTTSEETEANTDSSSNDTSSSVANRTDKVDGDTDVESSRSASGNQTDAASKESTSANSMTGVNESVKEHDDDKVTRTTDYGDDDTAVKETRTKSGIEVREKEGKETVTDSVDPEHNTKTHEVINNGTDLAEQVPEDHLGVEHTVEGNTTQGEHVTEASNKHSTTPYVTVGQKLRIDNEQRNVENSIKDTTTNNVTMDRTTDYNTRKETIEDDYKTTREFEYGDGENPLKETIKYGATGNEDNANPKEVVTKEGTITDTIETEGKVSITDTTNKNSNETTSEEQSANKSYSEQDVNNTHTTEGSVGESTASANSNNTNTSNSNSSMTSEGTENSNGSETTAEESKTTESGNKWWSATNQQMIQQELELRMNNFYDQMLKDVAKLLTLSIYNQEEIR